MAKVVLAIATTHGPQLHTTVDQWKLRLPDDQRNMHPFRGVTRSFDELVHLRVDENLSEKSNEAAMTHAHRRCQQAMASLADVWRQAECDVAIIFGNDQQEIYGDD